MGTDIYNIGLTFPYKDSSTGATLSGGTYDLYFEFTETSGNKTNATSSSALTVNGNAGDCEAVNPSGLKQYDSRVPLIIVGADYNLSNASELQAFKQRAQALSAINVSPVDTSHFTVWMSLESGKDACPSKTGSVELLIYQSDNNEPSCAQDGRSYALDDRTILCQSVNSPDVIEHELGHVCGDLLDEYDDSTSTPFSVYNRNCFSDKSPSTTSVCGNYSQKVLTYNCNACKYFQSISSSFVCSTSATVHAGCNYDYSTTGTNAWYRSINSGMMANPGSPFGEINEKLFKSTMGW